MYIATLGKWLGSTACVTALCVGTAFGATPATPAAGAVPAEAAPLPDHSSRPNILVWMIDDVGFGQLGCYGGLVDTPNLDKLAQHGLRYTNYRTTPVCSSSRAAFLTGRQSHAVGMGNHVAIALPFPGYDGKIPAGAGTIAENLRQAGYATYALGKWDHLRLAEMSQAGPLTYWPVRQGFDRFYGFLAPDTDNFRPQLWSDQTPVTLPADPDYHLSKDLADHAIQLIEARDAAEEARPFFMYFATGAAHAPHHAPDAYLARYRGRFDMGWDKAREMILKRQIAMGVVPRGTKLPPRPANLPAWDSLTPDEKRLHARGMEAFAASLTYADEQFGRILKTLEERGEADNSIVLVTADNGASGEGSPGSVYNEAQFSALKLPSSQASLKHLDQWGRAETFPNYSTAWAVAGDTPFKYYKITAYEGGIHVPLIISWPKHIPDEGALRGQFTFVSDVTPTLLDAAGQKPAAIVNNVQQIPFDGLSFAKSFADRNAPEVRKTQYFEMWGNRAIVSDGWKAVVAHNLNTWDMRTPKSFEGEKWELYDLRKEINELTDLSARYPEQLRKMQSIFDEQARRYHVYPIQDVTAGGAEMANQAAASFQRRGGVWRYAEPVSRVQWTMAPPVLNRSFLMTADMSTNQDGGTGPIWILGGRYGGMGLYLLDGRPTFSYRDIDLSLFSFRAETPLPHGSHKVGLRIEQDKEGADVTLYADERKIGGGRITQPISFPVPLNDSFGIGVDVGSGVAQDYAVPASFTGTIRNIRFDFQNPGVGAAK